MEEEPKPFSKAQIEFLKCVGIRVRAGIGADGRAHQAVYNDWADKSRKKIDKLNSLISEFLGAVKDIGEI